MKPIESVYANRVIKVEKEKRIIVMGGSFNPPTIAHWELMRVAMQETGAEKGIFVPVSQAYLKRKMRRTDGRRICLSAQLRLSMLRAMCEGSAGMEVSEAELDSPRSRTNQTMAELQAAYPAYRLYFLAGADKLKLITHWRDDTDFFERFGVVLFRRQGAAHEELGEDWEALRQRGRLMLLRQPTGVEEISSTAVRDCLLEGRMDEARRYLHPEVWKQFVRLTPEDFPPEIERFQGQYEFMDNRYPASFTWAGRTWLCAEAALQAARCAQESQKLLFVDCSGDKARKRAVGVIPRADWESVRLALAEEILCEKFRQNPELARQLKETGDAILIAGGGGKDVFWGVDLYQDIGENRLGILLMKIRSQLMQSR